MSGGQQGGTPPPAGGQGGAQGGQGDGEAGRIQSLDARFAAIETEQKQQAGMLEKIAAAVGAGGGPGPGAQNGQGAPAGGPAADARSIAEQVRQEIADADQRRKAEEDDKTWRAGVTEVVEQVKAEKAPRPPQTGPLAVARRLVLGKGWDA